MKTSKAVVFEKGNLCFRSEFFNSICHFETIWLPKF